MDFVIVTAPNPPGSKQLISPPEAVFEIAPGKVLHGAVRLHGLASSPTPDTHVRVACAFAADAKNTQTANTAKALRVSLVSFIWVSSFITPSMSNQCTGDKNCSEGPNCYPKECRQYVGDRKARTV